MITRLKKLKEMLFYNFLQSDLLALNLVTSCGSFATAKSVNFILFSVFLL